MGKIVTFSCFLFSVSMLFSQSLKDANKHFDRFEYQKAAEQFELYAKTKPLKEEDFKRYGYALFVTGQFTKCLPISDSIIKLEGVEPFFHYMNGETNMATRNFSKAKSSFEKYQKLDKEYNVTVKIQSCDLIPTWEDQQYLVNRPYGNNTSKADITGAQLSFGEIRFSETGRDSLGNVLEVINIDDSELVLSRPNVSSNSELRALILAEEVKDVSITSLAELPETDKVYFTVSKPLSTQEIDLAPHIYQGILDKSIYTISSIEPWQYSGLTDTSATAHATINASGNVMVFTRMNKSTLGSDLFISTYSGQFWSQPEPLNMLNTELDEMYPNFSGDTLLTFSSNGRPGYGGLDLYSVTVEGGEFKEIQHLKAPLNSFKDDFNLYYFSADSARYTSNREAGKGDDDMYFIKFRDVPPVEIVDVPDSSDFNDFVSNWVMPRVYFQFDKFNIEKDISNIDKLVGFFGNYPSSKLIITGHTDNRGSKKYNIDLGLQRANAVKGALVKAGIKPEQIEVSTMGMSEPSVDCSRGCSEAQHAMNRVAIIQLLAK